MTSADLLRTRYLEELFASARMLDTVETAAMAEAWASGAVAEWSALGGVPGRLREELEEPSPLGASLVRWIEGGEAPTEGADWTADVGRHDLVRVVRLLDAGRPAEVGWIFEYEAPSGDRHDLSATIADDTLVGLSVGPAGLTQAAADDETSGFVVREATLDDARQAVQRCLDQPVGGLSESAEATLPLLARRLGVVATVDAEPRERRMPDRDPEDDRYAAEVIRSALRVDPSAPPTEEVEAAHARFLALIGQGDVDAHTVLEVAGITDAVDIGLTVFVRAVGAYLAPVDLTAHDDAQFGALAELEPADWAGVILGLSRAEVGTDIDGGALVTMINRAPEITTTIPKRDAPRIAWTFEQMLFAWEATGVLDPDGRSTGAASWLLPRAALAAWDGGL